MNKVISNNNGGFPVVLDDLRFNEQATRDAFYGLLSAFGVSVADSFIISGCVITGLTYSAGWISLSGEILKVDGGALPAIGFGQSRYWVVDVTYDLSGTKVMENSSTVQAYEVRNGKIITLPIGSPRLPATALTPRLTDKIIQMMVADNSSSDVAAKILAVIAASDLYASSTPLTWNAYTPTFTAFDSSDGVVSPGVIVTSFSARWLIFNNTLFIRMSSVDISVFPTVRYITMSLPSSSLLTGKTKIGTAVCKFSKYAITGSGLPVIVNVDLGSSGTGDPFMMEKADKTDFGALNSYDFRFSIAISLI